MGDARFTAGIIWQMVTKSKYTSSFAVHGPLMEPSMGDEAAARKEVKNSIEAYYNREYKRQKPDCAVSEQIDGPTLFELLGSKRPRDQWNHRGYNGMHSFYAGKVIQILKGRD